jgi:hypothetical protein
LLDVRSMPQQGPVATPLGLQVDSAAIFGDLKI